MQLCMDLLLHIDFMLVRMKLIVEILVWDGNTYIAIPMEADGFKYANGQLPRPTLTISNVTNVITTILLNVNQVTPGNDLTGAVVKEEQL